MYILRHTFALHPVGDGESGDSLKGTAEGAVTLVTTPYCQSECGNRTVFLSCFAIEMDEVVDAQAVDVVVIGRPLFFEIATQIVAIRLMASASCTNVKSFCRYSCLPSQRSFSMVLI